MKLFLYSRVVLAGALLLLIQACATVAPADRAALVGTWTNALGTVWSLKSDGAFDVDVNHNGKRDAWGTYSVSRDTITIVGTGGLVPGKGCKGTGVYRFTQNGNTLHFTLVNDSCKLRKKNLLRDWQRK